MADPGARGHPLDIAGADNGPVANAVPMFEGALQDIGNDLHVAVSMGVEARPRSDPVLVDDSQRPEPHVIGIVVMAESSRLMTYSLWN